KIKKPTSYFYSEMGLAKKTLKPEIENIYSEISPTSYWHNI
ncbi:hypothetical protein J831_4540, partial [Acinetobacter baumannii 25691_8]